MCGAKRGLETLFSSGPRALHVCRRWQRAIQKAVSVPQMAIGLSVYGRPSWSGRLGTRVPARLRQLLVDVVQSRAP